VSALTLLAASALLFWLNVKTGRQPAKAITYLGAWFLLALAVALVILGIPNLGVLL